MPIDYSKWDRLDEYDDDDDDDDDEHSTDNPMEEASPRVTRLDAPSTVTFGGGQATIVAPSSSSSSSKQQQQATTTPAIMAPPSSTSPETRNATPPTPSTSITATTAAASASSALAMNPKWSEKGGMVVLKDDDDDDNAAKSRQLFWSQDRYSVTLRLQLLPAEVETSKKSTIQTVQVEGILPYEDRHCATGTCHQKLVVITKENTKLWEGTLPHPVHLAQDDDDIDWCLETTTTTTTTLEDNKNNNNKKFLTIHLFKAVPMQGLFVWWKRPVMECDEQQGAASSDDTRDGASQEFLQAWEEAHRQFRAKKNSRPPPQPL